MSKNSVVQEKAKEIRRLTSEGHYEKAAINLMFLTEDFSSKSNLNEVTILKGEISEIINESNVIGNSQSLDLKKNKAIRKLLFLLNKVEEENEGDPSFENLIRQQNQEVLLKERPHESPANNPIIENDKKVKTATYHPIRNKERNTDLHSINDIILSLDQVEVKFGDFVLQPISLEIQYGKVYGLVGANASGKTTLLEIIAGLAMPTEGELRYSFLNNEKYYWSALKRSISYVPQERGPSELDVLSSLKYSAAIHGLRRSQIEPAVKDVIARLNLEEHENKDWNQLSSGFKMRFELAKALVWRPKLLILDEPLANLDINAQFEFLQDVRKYAGSLTYPLSVLISSQHISEIELFSDFMIYMESGEMKYFGQTKQLEDQHEKIFEMIIAMDLSELRLILFEFDEKIKLLSWHNYKIVKTQKSRLDFLAFLIEKRLDFKHFNDLSTSTKKIFIDNAK